MHFTEKFIGYNDVKTVPGVFFYVQRNNWYSSPDKATVIPYELERLNIGGAMNLATGVFTAPVNGRYHFSFTGIGSKSSDNYVDLRVNGVKVGRSHAPSENYNMPIFATLRLTKGDTVDTYLSAGALNDSSDSHYTHFSGFLLEEDLGLMS